MDLRYRDGAVVHLYVLGASDNPDHIDCHVPWAVDGEEIFFGPCKKSLRFDLKRDELREADERVPEHDIYVVGLNALPSRQGPRKIVWAGRINRLMTFARAHDLLVKPRYEKMLNEEGSPLHVEPIRGDAGTLLGYHFRSNGVHPHDWSRDLTTTIRDTILDGDRLLLRSGVTPLKGFARDLCFTADNIFFANGQGIPIDQEAVEILERAQPKVSDIDAVAVFGRRNGVSDGHRGRYLSISEPALVARFLRWLQARRSELCSSAPGN
jgi:hypothetical protein